MESVFKIDKITNELMLAQQEYHQILLKRQHFVLPNRIASDKELKYYQHQLASLDKAVKQARLNFESKQKKYIKLQKQLSTV